MPFDDKEPKIFKKGLKLNNENSSVPPPKPNPVAAFNEQAKEAFNKMQDYKQRAFELATRFKSLIEDRILPDNKTSISKDMEKEVIDKLIALASDMNNDDNQPEGLGGLALTSIIMKTLLAQRDTINLLAYKVEKLEKQKL